jgi:hypothetical protein
VGEGARNLADLVLALLFMAGFFYYYVAGVVEENRALSRAAALAFLVCGVLALVMFVKVVL